MINNRHIVGLAALGALIWYYFRARPLTASVSTSESFNLGLTPKIRAFADAIARQEGFYVSGSIPNRANNPGDLALGAIHGVPPIGEGISVFGTANEGWNALYDQLARIINGQSSHYTLDTTIADMGITWSGGDPNWARNVAAILGVPVTTPLYEVLV